LQLCGEYLDGDTMQAVVLIGHGSLRSASGASMIRCAARLRERGMAPLVAPAFLNYSRPTLAETAARLAEQGVRRVWVQPYFLIAGAYVQQDLPALVRRVAADHPEIEFTVGEALGEHPALVDLALARAQAAALPTGSARRGLLLMAHGTPLPAANAPLAGIAAVVARRGGFAQHAVAYLDCNAPDIPTGLAEMAAAGAAQIMALPYVLHLGRHVAEDLPRLVAQAEAALPQVRIVQAQHLGYDPLLVDALAARIAAGTENTGFLVFSATT
jgi:sirohydrochlorin cobaltochelatase